MKLGILGTGKIVKTMLPVTPELEFEKIYLLSTVRSAAKAEELAAQYSLDGCFTDYSGLLGQDVDTIYIALPNDLHAAYAKEALKKGKHVIIEKPAVSTPSELLELRELAREKGLMILEAMTLHYLPAYQALRKDLAKLGRLKIASLNYSQYSSRYDAFREGTVLPAFDPARSGGALMDLNVYNIHFLAGLFGKPEAVSYHANVERGIDTSGILTMDYGSFQAVCIGAKDCQAPLVSTLQGDGGYIRMTAPVSRICEYELSDNHGNTETVSFEKERHRMYYEFIEFIRIIEQKDFQTAEKMLDISMTAAEILTEARKQAGIIFPADRSA